MKQQIKFLLKLLCLFTFTIWGCNKNATEPGENLSRFSMEFTRSRILGNGWAILHNTEGNSALAAKPISGDGLIDFGDTGNDRVTVTYIDKYELFGRHTIRLFSYLNVPGGSWTLRGSDFKDRDFATVSVAFPAGNYDGFILSGPNISTSGFFIGVVDNLAHPVLYLDDNETFSAFSSVYRHNDSTAFCGWILNQPFPLPNPNDSYIINLDQPMEVQTINSSRPFTSLTIGAYRGELYHHYTHARYSYSDQAGKTNHFVHYSSAFPAHALALYGTFSASDFWYSMRYINKSLPSQLNVANASVNATYNSISDKVENISVSGTADRISAYWQYSDSDLRVIWFVYGSAQIKNITHPSLPDSVINNLGLDLSRLQLREVRIYDYDTTKNIDDMMKMFFKTDAALSSLYTTRYIYSKRFSGQPSAVENFETFQIDEH